MSQLDAAISYAHQKREQFIEEFKTFLSMPSISTLHEHAGDVQNTAEWLAEQLRALGMEHVEIMPTGGHPIVYGDWLHAKDKPTMLVYGHYDVQPADPLNEWDTPPFEPTVRDKYIYARGASDMKGQLFGQLKALESLVKNGKPPVNIKYVLEGEEEIGSAHLEPFLQAEKARLAADFVLNCDAGIHGPDTPSLIYSLRGLAYFELHVRGPAQDLHSGRYGGVIHNPAQVLCELIAAMHDEHNRVTLPGFYDSVRELTDMERSDLSRVAKSDDEWLRQTGAPKLWGEDGFTATERVGARPTLEVNGIVGGYIGEGAKTVLPAKAHAKISCRLVADQKADEVADQLRAFVGERAPDTVTWEIKQFAGAPAGFTERDTPWMKTAVGSLKEVFGKEPIFVREGGTIPVVGWMKEHLNLDTVLLGFALPDDGIHGPNEKQYLPNFYKGIDTYIRFMSSL